MKAFFRVLSGIIIGIALASGGIILYGRLVDPIPKNTPPLPMQTSGVLTHAAGPVYIFRKENIITAYPGLQIEAGDVVRVTQGAVAQVQFADRGSALLGDDTLVRFLKLTSADQKIELRTEILTGTLSYKMETLDSQESVFVEVNGTQYEVRGTEFFIRKTGETVLLTVREGQVRVSGKNAKQAVFVNSDQQLIQSPTETLLQANALTESNRTLMDAYRTMSAMPFGYENAPTPILLKIKTSPADALIYIDGQKSGTSQFSGLFPMETTVRIRVRRAGFKDKTLSITTKKNRVLQVELEPEDIQNSLGDSKEGISLAEKIREEYELRMAELRNLFASQSERNAQEQAQELADIQTRLESQQKQTSDLGIELEKSRYEVQQLKDVLKQINSITDE